MICLYRFRPDPARNAEFLACLWQGSVPDDLRLDKWLYIDGDGREMVLLCECDEPGRTWIEHALGSFGVLTSETVTDSTPGLAACLERDLDAFGAWMRSRGAGDGEVARQLDVRRRGLSATSRDEALRAGRAWARDQASTA